MKGKEPFCKARVFGIYGNMAYEIMDFLNFYSSFFVRRVAFALEWF